MDLNSKIYKVSKAKSYFKNSSLSFFFHVAKLSATESSVTEKNLKKLKLEHYKIFNTSGSFLLENSIFRNYRKTICSTVLFVKPQYKLTVLNSEVLKKQLEPSFILLFVKLNNRIYSLKQTQKVETFSYKESVSRCYNLLNSKLKLTYVLTNRIKKSKQCDLNT